MSDLVTTSVDSTWKSWSLVSVKVVITSLQVFSGLIVPRGSGSSLGPFTRSLTTTNDKNVSEEHLNVGHKFQMDFVLLSCKSLQFS